MPTKWYETKVVSITRLSPTVKEFVVQIEEEELFRFLPGQFVTMDLPVGEKRLDRWRSYSIANEPNDKNLLAFSIVRFENGLGSCYFHDVVEIGDTIRWKGPDGGFVLPAEVNRPLIFLATGTGIAPFRSMIRDLVARQVDFPSIHLIFGTRHEKDIIYRDEMEKLAINHPNFRYNVALSREDKPGFTKGYIHEIYMAEEYVIPSDTLIFICGWSQMIDQAVELLLIKKKVNKEQIKFELYG